MAESELGVVDEADRKSVVASSLPDSNERGPSIATVPSSAHPPTPTLVSVLVVLVR